MKQIKFLMLLREHDRKRIPLPTIMASFHATHGEYDDHANIREPLLIFLQQIAEEGNILLPKSKHLWDRLGTPALPKWIQIVDERKPKSKSNVTWLPELAAIESELTPQQIQIMAEINKYLIEHRGELEPIPFRERALKIFGDEHFLDGKVNRGTLFQGRLPLSALYAFETYEPMPYECPPSRVKGRPIIILENHHSFASFVLSNAEQDAFSAVCFSSGNTLTRRERSLESIGQAVESYNFLYLGDIDPPGISFPVICNEARIKRKAAPLKPAIGLYRWLINNGIPSPLPSNHKATISSQAEQWFTLDTNVLQKIHTLFSNNTRIAQESLDLSTLRRLKLASLLD